MKHGIFDGYSFADYRAMEAINKSGLDLVRKSPAHWKHAQENPEEPTAAMTFGAGFHDYLLLPAEFSARYVEAPKIDKRAKEGKELFAEFQKNHIGKTLLSSEDLETMRGMAAAIKAHPEASKFLSGVSELSCFWQDQATTLNCKARPDIIHGATVVDIKTTADASFSEFQRSIAKFRYHVQAAWYLDGIAQYEKVDSFVIIAVEKSAPFAVATYIIDEATIDKGREEYRKDLETFAACKKSGIWPAYSDELQPMNLPAWAWN